MAKPRALLLSVSTGMYMHFDTIGLPEFLPTHGILPLDGGIIQHYLSLMDRVAQLDLPNLEEVVFNDSWFKLLRTPFGTEEEMVHVFGAAEILSFTTEFGHSVAATVVPTPRASFVEEHAMAPERSRLSVSAEGGMFFSGDAGRHLPSWESFGLDRDFLRMQMAKTGS